MGVMDNVKDNADEMMDKVGGELREMKGQADGYQQGREDAKAEMCDCGKDGCTCKKGECDC